MANSFREAEVLARSSQLIRGRLASNQSFRLEIQSRFLHSQVAVSLARG